jgi:hypothetical protein
MTPSDADYAAYVRGRIPALRRLAYHLSGDVHQADDLVQETIAKLYAAWGRISAADGLDQYTRTTLVARSWTTAAAGGGACGCSTRCRNGPGRRRGWRSACCCAPR